MYLISGPVKFAHMLVDYFTTCFHTVENNPDLFVRLNKLFGWSQRKDQYVKLSKFINKYVTEVWHVLCWQERLKKVANFKSTGRLRPRHNLSKIMPPSHNEVTDTFKRLSEETRKSIVLLVVPGYAKALTPFEITPSLSSLYDKALVGKPIDVIKAGCEQLIPPIKWTKEQLDQAELFTRKQGKVSAWCTQKAERFTASKAK